MRTPMNFQDAARDLAAIFRAGLDRVDPCRMIEDHVRLEGSRLVIRQEDESFEIDLDSFEKIFILGAGKATAPMAAALESILGERVSRGLIVVKYGHTAPLKRVETIEAGHPVPDENGVKGAFRLMELAREADEKTLVLTLVSGGGSALLPCPMSYGTDSGRVGLTLADKQETTKALLRCGADIREINCIRKHLSGLKGGRLLKLIAPARSVSFILSDVVGDDLSSIASGLTAPDPTTYADALGIIEKYGIIEEVPQIVMETLRLGKQGRIEETLKQGAEAARLSTNILIGTNLKAMAAARKKARELGYNTAMLTSRVTGEAREVARLLAAIAADTAASEMLVKKPACVISGGEPVVHLQGEGKGGRCQEMALAFLMEIKDNSALFESTAFLAASTDGNDGPTDAAGAFAAPEILRRAEQAGLSLAGYLRNNDSYNFFDRVDGLHKTGPTNTNVCDLHLMLIR